MEGVNARERERKRDGLRGDTQTTEAELNCLCLFSRDDVI